MQDALHSSKGNEWSTPQWLFELLDKEFSFVADVAATAENAKCVRFVTEAQDALSLPWQSMVSVWMNPPYGREIGKWMRHARESAEKGALVCCLVPARTDTRWWWENCLHGEIRFLPGRLRFGGCDVGAPFPSAVIIFHPHLPPESRLVRFWNVREKR